MTNLAKIKEIFTSIQGEGPYVGVKQLFVRFCGCNLSCRYCDTNFDIQNSKTYSVQELLNEVNKHSDCHSVSLTGGEPLLHSDFLKEFLPKCMLPVYLETNATLTDKLEEIIDYVDFISADIKLPSCAGCSVLWAEHDRFFEKANKKELFAKIVFDEYITEEEIIESVNLAKKYDIELILQPKCKPNSSDFDVEMSEAVFERFFSKYKRIRLIPQVHKFLNIR